MSEEWRTNRYSMHIGPFLFIYCVYSIIYLLSVTFLSFNRAHIVMNDIDHVRSPHWILTCRHWIETLIDFISLLFYIFITTYYVECWLGRTFASPTISMLIEFHHTFPIFQDQIKQNLFSRHKSPAYRRTGIASFISAIQCTEPILFVFCFKK